jgi:hypothetical protein
MLNKENPACAATLLANIESISNNNSECNEHQESP